LVRGEEGSTLIELVVAMPIAVVLIGVIVATLGSAGRSQQDVERRSEALSQGQIGLERMTRELRQAQWVLFRSSSVVDLQVPVRAAGATTSTSRLVRYDCSGAACVRSEGPATAYPPPAAPAFTSAAIVVGAAEGDPASRAGRVAGQDVFFPQRVDAEGNAVSDYLDPTLLEIKLRLDVSGRSGPIRRILLVDGVALRNRSTFR
jgi:Tfp pilus assembly protein PilW